MHRAFAVILLLFAQFSSAEIIISEVHPHPLKDQSLNEWVELYNNGSEAVNVSGWVFGDAFANDVIEGPLFGKEGAIIPGFGFAILTDETTRVYENYNVSDDAIHLYIDGGDLGRSGLDDDGEQLFLYSNGTLISAMNYSTSKDGFSISLINGTFYNASPTPGYHNNGSVTTSCDYEVQIVMNGSLFTDPNDFSWKLVVRNVRGGPTNMTARAAIHDLFGNLEQEYQPFTNHTITTKATSSPFSPNLEEGKSYILSTNITTECGDSNKGNDGDERIFTIQGTLTTASYLTILSVLDLGSDDAAAFGQTIRMRLNAYRGDTGKESVAAWVENSKGEKLSKQSRASVEERFSNVTLTLPVQLVPNCGQGIDDGTYTLKVEGLDTEDERRIDVEGITNDLCEEIEVQEQQASTRRKILFEMVDLPQYANNRQSTARLRITNNNQEEVRAGLWSYLYRGSVSYSGEREANRETIVLPPDSVTETYLSNTPSIKEEGSYKAKFLLLQDGLKTPQDITFDISISQSQEQSEAIALSGTPSSGSPAQLSSRANVATAIPLPETIFSSSARKAQDLAPLILIITLTMLLAVFVWRR